MQYLILPSTSKVLFNLHDDLLVTLWGLSGFKNLTSLIAFLRLLFCVLLMCTELFFACIPPWYLSVTSECLVFLILHENVFPDVILICHPLYKEKHMLAIRGAVRMQLLGNQSSYAILRNPIFIIYLKRCKNAERWDDLQSLRKVAEHHVWPSLLDVLSRRTPSSPGAALAKGSGIWAWGGEAKLCLGTLHSPFLQMINFYFSRLHFAMCSLLSLIFMLKVGLGCRGKILG